MSMRPLVAVVLLVAASPISAEAGEMPRAVAAEVRRIGPVIDPPSTAKLYAGLHRGEPYAGVAVSRDQSYGPDARNRLDVFRSSQAGLDRPVLIFVHGGGYERGDKRSGPTSPFYDNVMLWAVSNGMVGINMTYRLAPANAWPAAAQDVSAAVDWTRSNIAQFGGDPQRIFIMGHSAGATHVASFIAHPELARGGNAGIAGAILVSGTFDLKPEIEVPGQRSYFGADTSKWDERSSLAGLVNAKLPLLVARGEIDVPYYIVQADILRSALCAQQRCPTSVILQDHSHMSEIYALNTDDTTLAASILQFVEDHR